MTSAALHTQPRATPEFFGVKIPCIAAYWPEAWDLLAPAVARNGLYTRESVLDDLLSGNFQLWIAQTDVMLTAAVTEIADFPATGIRQCQVVLMGGQELERCLPFLGVIEAWAKSLGCHRVVASGRRGLARKLKGYREGSVTLTKELFDG